MSTLRTAASPRLPHRHFLLALGCCWLLNSACSSDSAKSDKKANSPAADTSNTASGNAGGSSGDASQGVQPKSGAPAIAADLNLIDPKSTYVLMISLITWQHSENFPSFPAASRRDGALQQAFQTFGIGSDHLLALYDQQATSANIRTAVKNVVAAAGPNSTLIVYYQGHGIPTPSFFMASYDANYSDMPKTSVGFVEIDNYLAQAFQGTKVLFFGDACYSGMLGDLAARMPTRIKAGAITSATPTIVSTGNWTYTESLISLFDGSANIDANKDGSINFMEAYNYTKDKMRTIESQDIGGGYNGSFNPSTTIAKDGPTMASAQ